MANYIENFASKLDWAMPFQRTGAFPLDRTNLFESLADAQLYAQGGADKRGLGGTSYIGQMIVVYENDVVTAYIINADRSLKAMASTASDGSNVQSVLDALNAHKTAYDAKVKELENADKAISGRLDIIEGEVNVEGSIKKALADAKADATAKDEALHTAISAEIDADVKVVSDALNSEITRAKAAEKANADAIEAEKTRAEGEETRIEGLVTAEKTRAEAAEQTLTNNLAKEVERATNVENGLSGKIDIINGEANVEGSIKHAVAAEAKSREDKDKELKGAIDAINENLGATGSIGNRLSVVEGKATALEGRADTLEGKVSDLETAVGTKAIDADDEHGIVAKPATGLYKEVDDLKAADAALDSRLDSLEGVVGDAQSGLVKKVDDNTTAIAAINNETTGILAKAKKYTDDELAEAIGVAPSEGITGSGLLKDIADAEKRAKSYADTKIAGLVNEAPETLDTLKELADALGNDANFSTTVLNKIGEKANTTDVNAELDKKVDKVTGSRLVSETEVSAWNAKAEVSDVTAEQTRAEGVESRLQSSIDAINNINTGILATAKSYTDAEVKKVSDKVGDISTLDTEAKNTIVSAINELKGNINAINDVDNGILKQAKNYTDEKVGDINDLETDATNTVSAINELKGDIDEINNSLGLGATGTGTVSSRLNTIEGKLNTIQGAETVDGSIAKALKDAKDYADQKDGALHTTITGEINTAVEAEKTRAEGIEAGLRTDVDNKVSKSDYNTKVAALEKADTDNLAEAKKYADDQDTALHTTISTEIDTDVAAEAKLRSDADTALGNRIAKFEAGGEKDISELEKNLQAYADQAEADAISASAKALANGLANKADKEHGNHVPETQAVNNKMFLRNDNTWAAVTPENIGAAATSHGIHVTYATEHPKAPGTAAAGTSNKVAREDHVHPLQTTITGNAGTATKLATARTITVKGDATGSVSFDGSADKDLNLTLSNSGVATGSYGPTEDVAPNYEETFVVPQVTVDIKGRVTSATNRTITLPTQTVYENATSSKAGLMSTEDKTKLDGIEANANNYTHPESHPASMITESTDKRFVSDTEKADWNAKETTDGAQSKADTAAANALKDAKTYADQKISNLVNSAPETLDTLKELADALGNDANFATTVSTEIGKKADKTYVDGELVKITTGDGSIGARLTAVEAKNVEQDTAISTNSTNLTAEINRAKAAEEANATNISDNKSVLDKLDGSVTTEGSVKKQIKDAIDGITTGDGSIGTRLTAVETKNTEQDTAITNAQNQANKGVADAAAEKTRAEAAEKVLTDNLAAEVTRAKAAEKTNSDAITILNGDSTIEGSVDKKIADNNIFDTDILTVNALGGIKAGENLNGMTIEEVLKKLLYPYVAHLVSASSSPNGGVFECGNNQTVTEIKANITKKSEPITKVEFVDGSTVLETKTDGITAGGSVIHNCSIMVSTNKLFTVKVTDKAGTIVTATTNGFNFVYPYYWGVCANDATINEAMVKGLTKKVETKGQKGITYTANFQRAVIAYPASYGDIKKILDPNSFDVTATFTKHSINVTGLDGKSVAYYVYVNSAFTATNFKFTFSY